MLSDGEHALHGTHRYGRTQGSSAGRVLVDRRYAMGFASDDGGQRKLLLGVQTAGGLRMLKLAPIQSATHPLAYALRAEEDGRFSGHWTTFSLEDAANLAHAYQPLSEAFFVSEQEALAVLYDIPRSLLDPIRGMRPWAVRQRALGTGAADFRYVGDLPWR